MVQKTGKRGLGRGLSALMADIETPDTDRQQPDVATSRRMERTIPVEAIRPNPDQPRRQFSEGALNELASSIREKGVIQPLILRPDPQEANFYQIVAGERRWRAAQLAQLHELPAIVRDFDDTEVLEVAIIENIQRADLNAMEEAMGYRQLMDRFGHTQEKLAEAMGKSRSHIANLLRLMQLPEDVQQMVRDGRLSAGHARALVTSKNASALARDAVAKGLSVRQVEQLAKDDTRPKSRTKRALATPKDADTVALEGDLSASLGMAVEILHDAGTGKGKVSIQYKDLQDLDDLMRKLTIG